MFFAKLGAVIAIMIAVLTAVSLAQNTATVSTNLSFLTSNPASGNVKMVMVLVNCGQNNPRVIGTSMLVSPPPPFIPNSGAHVFGYGFAS